MATDTPLETKKEWLVIQGQGCFKNWKKRYFVLENGTLSYFKDASDDPQFGNKLKGQLHLNKARLDDYYSAEGLRQNKMIYIVSGGSERDMLLDLNGISDDEARSWIKALDHHITHVTTR